MSPLALVIVAVIVALAAYALLAGTPKLGRAVDEALEAGDLGPLLAAIERIRPSGRTAAFNHAIRQLWDRYERGLAVDLVKVLVQRHQDALIAQYWLKHVMETEPALARERLSKPFVDRHYRPEVAARCGPVG